MGFRDAHASLLSTDSANEKGSSRSRSHSSAKSNGGSKYTNADLPFSLGNNKTWRNVFCDTVFEYMGTLKNPFDIEKGYIQDVWDVVYPHLDYEIKSAGKETAVFSIVSCFRRRSGFVLTA